MGYNGSGGYNRVHNWVNDKNGAIKITASRMDAEFDDFASAMELCILKDGQQDPTANLPMASFKHTVVGAASARTEYTDVGSYQDGKFVWAGLASGTSAIALTMNPTITAITTGMKVGFVSVGANASACSLSLDGSSSVALIKGKNEALAASDMLSGGAYWAVYKGADGFQLINPEEENPTFITLQTTGLATLGNVLCSGSAVFTSSLNVSGDIVLTSAKQITTPTNENLNLTPNGTGNLVLDGVKWPQADGSVGQIPVTDGAGQISWADGMTLLATASASASATVDFDTGIDWTSYKKYVIEVTDIAPATDTADLYVRTSTDGGSTYDAGASDYRYAGTQVDSNGAAVAVVTSDAASEIQVSSNSGAAANESGDLTLTIYNPAGTKFTKLRYFHPFIHSAGVMRVVSGGGFRESAADVDGIRFLYSSGNIASGEFKLYGVA